MSKNVVATAFVLAAAFVSLSPACLFAQRGFTPAKQKEFVDYHNKVRRDVGVGPVTWSPEIASVAQKWADYLASTGKFEHATTKYGENIAINSTTLKGAEAWYSEIKDYRPGIEMGKRGADYRVVGHYTQMVWNQTTKIGAGVAVMQRGNFKGQLVIVCNYDPPGNMTGQIPYGPGSPQPNSDPDQTQPSTPDSGSTTGGNTRLGGRLGARLGERLGNSRLGARLGVGQRMDNQTSQPDASQPQTSQPDPSSPAAEKSSFPKGYFYMTNRFVEQKGLVLESAPVTLRKRGDYSGMIWKAIPANNGYFYLTSQYLEGKNQVLEGGDGQGPAVMVPNKGYSGTMWKPIPAGEGYFFLTSAYMESQKMVLEGNVGDANANPADTVYKGGPHMVTGTPTGTMWKFIPAN